MGQDWEYQNFSMLSHRTERGGGENAIGACEVKLIEKIQILKERRKTQVKYAHWRMNSLG